MTLPHWAAEIGVFSARILAALAAAFRAAATFFAAAALSSAFFFAAAAIASAFFFAAS